MQIKTTPEYIFETSWEVCNRIGGIYAVLSTRAASMQKAHKDKVLFFGPDVWTGNVQSPYFAESGTLLKSWRLAAAKQGLPLRIGRWNVPGNPIAVLVDFRGFFSQKNEIYGHMWEKFGVDSIAAYGDYDEASMFGYAAGVAMESYYNYHNLTDTNPTVAHFNEWMTSFGLFYVKEHLPQVGTLFTTHATSIGRSIAGNQKPLYDHLQAYNGDQMAQELNMVSKHSAEKCAAHLADCFTTVSEITDRECAQLLEKAANVVTPNGFEAGFVPQGSQFTAQRKKAQQKLRTVSETLLGYPLAKDALFVATSGRYEYKNKGIDVFVEALKRLDESENLAKEVVAFIMVPGDIEGPRADLQQALSEGCHLDSYDRHTTHQLRNAQHDNVMNAVHWFGLDNRPEDKVKVIFVPSYLHGDDGIFNCSYYDLLIGMDLTIFPSYYEPWGYTPLESTAFGIPTITTSLAGFGQWASAYSTDAADGVGVVVRSDYNYYDVVNNIADMTERFVKQTPAKRKAARTKASAIAELALWKHFFKYYEEAYQIALLTKTAIH